MENEITELIKSRSYFRVMKPYSEYSSAEPSSRAERLKYFKNHYIIIYFIEESRLEKLRKQDHIKFEQIDKVLQITSQQLADMNWTIVYKKSERTMD